MLRKQNDNEMLKSLDNILRCKICSNYFKHCVITACGHYFCQHCIRKCIISEPECPKCCENISEEKLIKNKLVDDIVHIYKKIRSKSVASHALNSAMENSCTRSDAQVELQNQEELHEQEENLEVNNSQTDCSQKIKDSNDQMQFLQEVDDLGNASDFEIIFIDSESDISTEGADYDKQVKISAPEPSLWHEDFVIPWENMPNKLLYILYGGERPDKYLIRTMVRIICEEIRKFDLYPSRKILDAIARKAFELFPESLSDDPAVHISKYSYENLLTQLENRLMDYFYVEVKLTDIRNEITLFYQCDRTDQLCQSTECDKENCYNTYPSPYLVEYELRRNVSHMPFLLNSKFNSGSIVCKVENQILNHSVIGTDSQSPFLPSKWYKKFHIPWHKMSSKLLNALHKKQWLNPTMRKDMVKLISDKIRTITKHPDRESITYIAKKAYETFPVSLRAHFWARESLTKKSFLLLRKELMKEIKNLNRKENVRYKRSKYVNHYCCNNWLPRKLTKGETKKRQLQKKEELKVIGTSYTDTLDNRIIELLEDTFYSQQQDIIKSKTIVTIMKEWPLLCTRDGLLNHFKILVGFDSLQIFNDSLLIRANSIFYYFMYLSQNGYQTLNLVFQELENSKDLDKVESCAVIIYLIMAYFEEDSEKLFLTLNVPIKEGDAENLINLPQTPCLIICGESPFHGSTFMLSIHGEIFNKKISDFTTGFIMLFASFYVFDICFPVEVKSTLKFIQMYLFNIYENENVPPDKEVVSLIESLEKYREQGKVR